MSQLKIMPVTRCGAVGKCSSSPSSYESGMSTYRKPTQLAVAQKALADLEAARKADLATHEANAEALANNKTLAEQVAAFMEAIGVPKRFQVREQGRTRFKLAGYDAGYITDIRREIVTDDGFDAATNLYNTLLARYQQFAEEAKRKDEQEQRQREIEQQREVEKRKADMELAAILIRYELPIESTWSDVLQALRTRDQRLNLAVAMENVRGDWSDGCGEVVDAIREFSIQTNEDKDIINDVLGCTRDFEDGRVFRDTAWSYDVLYASVADQVLAKDCRLARDRARGY